MVKKQGTGTSDLVLPLDLLITYDGNMYELTCAAIKRAAQINLAGDDELEDNKGRVVSLAIKQILTKVRLLKLDCILHPIRNLFPCIAVIRSESGNDAGYI